jgi:hypothetical protein
MQTDPKLRVRLKVGGVALMQRSVIKVLGRQNP